MMTIVHRRERNLDEQGKIIEMKPKSTFITLLAIIGLIVTACTSTTGDSSIDSAPEVTPIITTALPESTTNSPTTQSQVQHNGIAFTYDPTLLGDVSIQDVPASADQGMFGEPTPAHTLIGFASQGIQHDSSYRWTLLREPQIIVFNLNDFGSFAPSDAQSRDRIAKFQQLLVERPSAFTDEIPVLPLVNAAQMIRAHEQWLDFDGGAGIRFVTEYSQDNLPIVNDRLMYIFYGMTSDGLHGVTAIFPLTHPFVPDVLLTDEDADTPYDENFVSQKLADITSQVNGLSEADFKPALSQLDALVQSITIKSTDSDYLVTTDEPQSDTAVNEPTGFFAGDGWQDVVGEYISFRVPDTWQPTMLTPGMGSVLAEWHLGIPGLESDQTIAFFAVPFDQLLPADIASENAFEIGGRPGMKWVRRGEGYVSYDYYTAGTAATQAAGAGSFGIHVTVPEADANLESIMDMVASSVTFVGQ